MGLFDTLRGALTPTLRTLTADVGVQVAIYRATASESAGAETTRTYAVDATWANVGAFFNAPLPEGVILNPFGARTSTSALLKFVRTAGGALPLVNAFDGFKILSGPYTGYTFLAAGEGVPDAVGMVESVSLVSAPAGVIP
jgi:hypothetical protein